jgi:8-oxo-dGTP diphosphatase
MSETPSIKNFPNLFQAITLADAQLVYQFELRDSSPPVDLISNVNLVPFIGDECLIIRLQNGNWEIPGGTLEPNESYLDTIRRELLEEAGARLVTFEPFGAWHCHSFAPKPYRPHLPHPESYRVVGYGQVELVSKPQNPDDGEQVALVECVSIGEASQRFLSIERPDLAELYQLADLVYREKCKIARNRRPEWQTCKSFKAW